MAQQFDLSSHGWTRAAILWFIIAIIAGVIVGAVAYQIFRPIP